MPELAASLYTRVTVDGQLAGHAFSCRWICNGKNVCWITQLVVSQDYRRRGLARSLLTLLRREDDDMFGIMSSHPFACLAAVRAFGSMCSMSFCHSTANIQEQLSSIYHLSLYANIPPQS
jgi:GNAT superfamily N-acetyltransferase